MDRTWLRAERVLYASTHALPPKLSSILLTSGGVMRGDMPIHPRFQPLLERRRIEGKSRRADRVDGSEKGVRLHVCMHMQVLAQKRWKCKHCTQDM